MKRYFKEEHFLLRDMVRDFSINEVRPKAKEVDTGIFPKENIDKMAEMDVSTGEHSKMDHWINGLMRIPFGKYNNIPVNPESSVEEKRKFIQSPRNLYA